jgi:hypothetical protein
MQQLLLDSAPAIPVCSAFAKLVRRELDPQAAGSTWAGVGQTPATWQLHPGSIQTWNVDYSRIRRTKGYLPTSVSSESPNAKDKALNVVFDEGCEVCTITRSALSKCYNDWATGHTAFSTRADIGKPRALLLKRPVKLHSFHGAPAAAPIMVLVHLRLQHAVYLVRCAVVDNAPGDIVLGLSFRRSYDVPTPHKFQAKHNPTQQGMGVTHMVLGVPKGFGVSLPPGVSKRMGEADPSSVEYKQVLKLDLSWQNWYHTGKELTSEALTPILGLTQSNYWTGSSSHHAQLMDWDLTIHASRDQSVSVSL